MKGFLVFSAVALFFLLEWAYTEINTRKDPLRVAACKVAGGDGRYELCGGSLFPRDLWCAHEDGTIFSVLDVNLPSTPTPE